MPPHHPLIAIGSDASTWKMYAERLKNISSEFACLTDWLSPCITGWYYVKWTNFDGRLNICNVMSSGGSDGNCVTFVVRDDVINPQFEFAHGWSNEMVSRTKIASVIALSLPVRINLHRSAAATALNNSSAFVWREKSTAYQLSVNWFLASSVCSYTTSSWSFHPIAMADCIKKRQIAQMSIMNFLFIHAECSDAGALPECQRADSSPLNGKRMHLHWILIWMGDDDCVNKIEIFFAAASAFYTRSRRRCLLLDWISCKNRIFHSFLLLLWHSPQEKSTKWWSGEWQNGIAL